jgi:hypothetical protein
LVFVDIPSAAPFPVRDNLINDLGEAVSCQSESTRSCSIQEHLNGPDHCIGGCSGTVTFSPRGVDGDGVDQVVGKASKPTCREMFSGDHIGQNRDEPPRKTDAEIGVKHCDSHADFAW